MQVQHAKSLRLIGALGGKAAGWYISPHGFNLYRAGPNDTVDGLADRYLGTPNRADEIWSLQSPAWRAARGDNPNNLRMGDELLMPQEAIDAAKALGLVSGGKGEGKAKAATGKIEVTSTDVLAPHGGGGGGGSPIAPKPLPGLPKPAPVAPVPGLARFTLGKKLLIGGVAVAAVLGGGVAVAAAMHHHGSKHLRKNPRRRHNPTVARLKRTFKGKSWG